MVGPEMARFVESPVIAAVEVAPNLTPAEAVIRVLKVFAPVKVSTARSHSRSAPLYSTGKVGFTSPEVLRPQYEAVLA